MENGNVINLQDFEQNEIPLKQRSFEDSIDTFFSLFDADLLLICITTSLPLKCGLEQQKDHLPKRRKRLGTS